jgi:hypothetical protein
VTITTVGAAVTNGGTGRSTVNVVPTSAGNILGMVITSQGAAGAVTGVSGGGATWTRGTSYFDSVTSSYLDAWWGLITAAGAATVTVAGISGTTFNVLWTQEFNESHPTWTWSTGPASPAAGASGPSLGSGLAVAWPSLSAPAAGDCLYLGNSLSVFGNMAAGATPGFTYPVTGFSSNLPAYNPAFAGTGGPTATQTNTGAYDTVGVLIGAAPPPVLHGLDSAARLLLGLP